jgi:formamidopyrimidine-DNA glycosylase
VRDYRTGTGEEGSYQLELLVYGREGEPCRRCGTRLAGTHAIDARTTVFCHRCQS